MTGFLNRTINAGARAGSRFLSRTQDTEQPAMFNQFGTHVSMDLPYVPMPERRPNTLQWMFGPLFNSLATWTTQLFGSYEDNIRAAKGLVDPRFRGEGEFRLPEFSTSTQVALGEYPNPEDIELSMSYRGRMNPMYWAEEALRGPETDKNQFLTSGRMTTPDVGYAQQYFKGLELARQANPEFFKSPLGMYWNANATAWGWLATVGNEQMVAETMNDPLILMDAFNVGAKIINGVNRAAGQVRVASPLLDAGLSGVRRMVDDVTTASWREVYRATRNILGEAGYKRALAREELTASQRAVRMAGPKEWLRDTTFETDVMPGITKLMESPQEVTAGIRQTRGLFGNVEAVDDIMEMVEKEFPEAPPLAQRRIAEFLDRAWEIGDRLPEIEHLFGMPTQRLMGDIEYAKHAYDSTARRAAYRSLPTWKQRMAYSLENQLGRDILSVLKTRKLRDSIADMNELAANGMLGFNNGKLVFLTPETANLNLTANRIRVSADRLDNQAVKMATSLERKLNSEVQAIDNIVSKMDYDIAANEAHAADLFETGGTPYEVWGETPDPQIVRGGEFDLPDQVDYLADQNIVYAMGRGAHQYTPEETLRLQRKGGMTQLEGGAIEGDSSKINKVYELAYRTGQATQIRGRLRGMQSDIGESVVQRGIQETVEVPAEAFIEARIASDLRQIANEVGGMSQVEAGRYLELYRKALLEQVGGGDAERKVIGIVTDELSKINRSIAAKLELLTSGKAVAGVRAGTINPVRIKRILKETGFGASMIPDVPDNFVPIKKLFKDNPWEILYTRYNQHTRAVAAATMLREASQNPDFVRAADAIDAPTIKDVIGESEFKRTFAQLGGDLEEIAATTRWRDKETALGVLEWARTARDITNRPNAFWNMVDTAISVWRGMTLTPFLGYHTRNLTGGMLNIMMSGKVDIFDIIDATFPTASANKIGGQTNWAWREFRRLGLDRTSEVKTAWGSTYKYVYDDPLMGSPIQSLWQIAKKWNPFGEGGQTVGNAIENHQRFAQFLGALRRGHTSEEATELTYKYLFDYMDIPRWFRPGTVARRISAFPTWSMKNVPLQLEHMLKTPTVFGARGRLINSIIRASGNADEPIPQYMTEQQGFQAPGGVLAPENFDPAANLGELADIIFPLLQGDFKKTDKATWQFIDGLLNPFVTYIPEALAYTAPVGSPGEPGGRTVSSPTTPESELTGWDFFRQRPIYRDYSKWNDAWKAFGVEGEMPAWAQWGDHALRSFVRAYNEGASVLAEGLRMRGGKSEYSVPEYGARRLLGVPYYKAAVDKTIYFGVRGQQRQIAAIQDQVKDNEATPEQLTQLKRLYMSELAYLAHGTFMELDPWTGDPRPWLDIAKEDEMTIKGKQQYWRDFLNTGNLLLYGRRGMGLADIHQPIPLTETEQEFIEGMMDAATQSYLAVMYSRAASEAEINIKSEENYVEDRREALEVRQ